jgi:hypothetical protein
MPLRRIDFVAGQEFVYVAQPHRLERKGKGRGAAGGEGKERVVVGLEIIGVVLAEARMKRIPVASFENNIVEKLNRHRNTFDICSRREQIDFLGERRFCGYVPIFSIDFRMRPTAFCTFGGR